MPVSVVDIMAKLALALKLALKLALTLALKLKLVFAPARHRRWREYVAATTSVGLVKAFVSVR